jgi:anti-sigma regulatory factor (Ser/Thr protein kinase)
MLKYNYSFELKHNLSELKALCEHLIKFGEITGLSKDCISEINLCLDEAFTNIVSYGFADDSEHLIKFTIAKDNDVLILRVEDDGIPFNPLVQKDPVIATGLLNIKVGGLGIHIMKKLMDDICYKRYQGKNKLILKKFIEADDLSLSI